MNKMIQTLSLMLLASASLVTAGNTWNSTKACVKKTVHCTFGTAPFDTFVDSKVKTGVSTGGQDSPQQLRDKGGCGWLAYYMPACMFKDAKNSDGKYDIKWYPKWGATIAFKYVPVALIARFIAKKVMKHKKKAAKKVVFKDIEEEEVTA